MQCVATEGKAHRKHKKKRMMKEKIESKTSCIQEQYISKTERNNFLSKKKTVENEKQQKKLSEARQATSATVLVCRTLHGVLICVLYYIKLEKKN